MDLQQVLIPQLNEHSIAYLEETRKWARFLSVLGFILIGFMVIAAFGFSILLSVLPGADSSDMPFPPALLGGIYLVLAVVYLFPVLYLFRFSNYLKDALRTGSDQDLELAFMNLKAHYKFISMAVIIFIALYFLAIIGGIFAGVLMG